MSKNVARIAAELFSRVWFVYAITIVAIIVSITMPRVAAWIH